MEVVGVSKTSKYLFVGEQPMKFVYLPFAQNPISQMLLIVQTESDAASVATPMRQIAQGLDANQPVFNLRTLSSFYQQRAIAVPMMLTEWVGAMGVAGLTLALVGLYALIAYSVSRRTQEIGVRIAIGASKGDVLKMVLREGLLLSGIGILIGGFAATMASRLLAAGLVGLATMNAATSSLASR